MKPIISSLYEKKFPGGNVVKALVQLGFVWTWVSRVLCECCCPCLSVCLSVRALFGWAEHTSAADKGWPLEQMNPIVVHISLVTVLPPPLPVHPAPSHGQESLLIPWQRDQDCSWATSGIAGLSWRLLLCSLCWFRHYLWLTPRDNTAVVQGEAVNAVLNIQTVLWAWEVKAWHSLSSRPLYFTLLLQYIYCNCV